MRSRVRPYSPPLSLQVLDALELLGVVDPTLADLAAELGRPAAEVRAALALLERRGDVEVFRDFGETRALLSARAASRRGLVLSGDGRRWVRRGPGGAA